MLERVPPMEVDDKRLYHLFRKAGMDEDGAYTAVQEVRNMAGQNIIARMEAQAAELKAEVRGIHRIIGYAAVGVGLFFGFVQMLLRLLE